MSEYKNRAQVEGMVATINRGDADAFAACHAEDVVIQVMRSGPLHLPADLGPPPANRFPSPLGILDRYQPAPQWWLADPWGLYGVTHAARVLLWSEQVVRYLRAQGVAVDAEVARWSAVLHDCRRSGERDDPGYGRRAAAWVLRHRDALPATLTDTQVQAIAHTVFWQPEDAARCPRLTPELQALKDANELEMLRFWGVDPATLEFHTAALRAPHLPRLAKDLAEATALVRGPDAWAYVRACAHRLGLWPAE